MLISAWLSLYLGSGYLSPQTAHQKGDFTNPIFGRPPIFFSGICWRVQVPRYQRQEIPAQIRWVLGSVEGPVQSTAQSFAAQRLLGRSMEDQNPSIRHPGIGVWGSQNLAATECRPKTIGSFGLGVNSADPIRFEALLWFGSGNMGSLWEAIRGSSLGPVSVGPLGAFG